MKLLLIILLLPSVCFSQKKINIDNLSGTGTKPGYVDYSSSGVLSKLIPKKDTVPSQKKDSLVIKGDNKTTMYSDLWAIPTNRREYYQTPKQDTIPIMLLVCDTFPLSKYDNDSGSELRLGNWSKFPDNEYRKNAIWWQFGYEVVKYKEENNGEQTWNIQELVGYLGQDKKPLSRNVFVWMSKEIKK